MQGTACYIVIATVIGHKARASIYNILFSLPISCPVSPQLALNLCGSEFNSLL